MEKGTKKKLTIFAIIAGFFGILSAVVGFFIRKEKKEVLYNGKKKLLYPQDLLLAKTLLPLIPTFITPTYISFLRIIMTPLAALLIANGKNLFVPLLVYLFVSFTDMIDGALARTRDQITDLGKVVDPVADKLLFLFSAIFLLPKFGDQILLIVIVLVELLTVIITGVLAKGVKIVSANIFGKIKMVVQVIGVACYIVAAYSQYKEVAEIGKNILFVSVVFLVLSSFRAFFLIKKLQTSQVF